MDKKLILVALASSVIFLGALYFIIGGKDMTQMHYAVIETKYGSVGIELYDQQAKVTTQNFKDLVGKKFYDGLSFHRVVPGFVVQGGDPKGDGTGGSDKKIALEIVPELRHDSEGIVAMARSADPNSASSQFYITLAPQPSLDDQYAVFGKVVSGMDIVKKITVGDVMTKVYLTPNKPQ